MQQYRVIVHDIDWESRSRQSTGSLTNAFWTSTRERCRLPWVAALQWAFTRALVAIRKT